MTGWSKLRKIKVLPRFNCQRPSTLNRILNDMSTRASVIEGLAGLVQTHGYDGINIDFEAGYATDRDALSAFTRALTARLHQIGGEVTIEVSPKYRPTTTGRSGFFDYPALAAAADHVFVMNWGYPWSTSGPGAPTTSGSPRVSPTTWRRCRIAPSGCSGRTSMAWTGPPAPARATRPRRWSSERPGSCVARIAEARVARIATSAMIPSDITISTPPWSSGD